MLEGRLGVNWALMCLILLGWVVTIAAVGLLSAGLFSFGVFAPSIQQSCK